MSQIGNKQIMAANIRRLMASKGKDRSAVCADLGFKYSTFSEWVNGTKYPRIDKIEIMANYFGVSKSDLIEEYTSDYDSVRQRGTVIPPGFQPLPEMVKVPLIGRIACGQPITAEENVEGLVDAPKNVHCDFALRCEGDSMIDAGISEGDIVFIRSQPEVNNGQIAAVRIGDEATLKRVYWDGKVLQLLPENRSYPPMVFSGQELEQIHIEGLAVAFVHWF